MKTREIVCIENHMNRQGYKDNSYPWFGYKNPSNAVRKLVSRKNKSLGKLPGIRYSDIETTSQE